jgi:hypothetical protein
VLALALIILAGALLTGTSSASRASVRAEDTREAIAAAEHRWRFDAAQFVAGWDSSMSALPIGGELRRTIGPQPVALGGTTTSTLRLVRIDSLRYLLSVSTQVGPDNAVRARRRAAMIMEAPRGTGNSAPFLAPILPLRWAQNSLY